MTELDSVIEEHMKYLVLKEQRSFCFADFRRFEVDGREYRITHGVFRNKICHLRKTGKVELDYKSGTAFYTLTGHRFSQMMTADHIGDMLSSRTIGRQTPLYKWLKNLPVEKQSLHNIRLRFEANGIWEIFYSMYPGLVDPINKNIQLQPWVFYNDIDVIVTVNHTDTVSVAIACSYRPIAVDITGLIDSIEALVRTEERITKILSDSTIGNTGIKAVRLPSYRKWIGVMWHFGIDGIDRYDKPEFHITFEEGISDIYTIYIKRMKDGRPIVRIDRQEYSKNPFVNIFLQKLYPGGYLT